MSYLRYTMYVFVGGLMSYLRYTMYVFVCRRAHVLFTLYNVCVCL